MRLNVNLLKREIDDVFIIHIKYLTVHIVYVHKVILDKIDGEFPDNL